MARGKARNIYNNREISTSTFLNYLIITSKYSAYCLAFRLFCVFPGCCCCNHFAAGTWFIILPGKVFRVDPDSAVTRTTFRNCNSSAHFFFFPFYFFLLSLYACLDKGMIKVCMTLDPWRNQCSCQVIVFMIFFSFFFYLILIHSFSLYSVSRRSFIVNFLLG